MHATRLKKGLYSLYYGLKLFPFRKERQARLLEGRRRGFVGIQIDGLSFPHLSQALDRGYLPHIERFLRCGNKLIEYRAGLPSTTPAAQAVIFYGAESDIPAFRWFERETGQVLTCNDPDHVQSCREKLFPGRRGLLEGGSSYSNILDGGAARSVFTVSSPHPQTLFGRMGGLRIVLMLILHPLRAFRMLGASVLEYFANRKDEWYGRRKRRWRTSEGLFPFIRIFCNVILRELQTFGVIADVYAGVPNIYTTYSGYDELAHHFGPDSWPALRNLRYIDKRIGEIMRAVNYGAGADYQLVLLSDHGQTPGYPFQSRFGATLGEAVSAFLREQQEAAVSSGPLEFTRIQLGFLREELDSRTQGWRHRVYRATKDFLQRKIQDLVPETLKVDPEGGVVITYSSSLAHLYITGTRKRLSWREVERVQPLLLRFLSRHKGIGFVVGVGEEDEVWFFHGGGTLCTTPDSDPPTADLEFLRPYGVPHDVVEEVRRYARSELCGDLVLFGAYDGEEIACFDDQVGGHGSVGGEQSRPFLILPLGHPVLERRWHSGYEFLYHEVFRPCLEEAADAPPA
ncbi:alkaline phosphatase family protein [uncultured Desulfuromonas sp.]|uniref:alkaline phosphatase family protein n=1 Tax=uncultured Desulfuromonas sp. TaxID=181013 RepID=UPI00260D9F5A|nr:alkaline phosphatase family protein [uncultured Desulfuromonas sp.]